MAQNDSWIDKLVSVLEYLYNFFLSAVRALEKVLENIVQALEGIIKRLIRLVEALLDTGFYAAPFILMVVIGPYKNWVWMIILGWVIISLAIIIFIINLIGLFRDKPIDIPASPENLRKLRWIIGVLNIFMVTYSVLYFGVGISAEREILSLFGKTEQNPKANL
jgi:uncharacterized membrane protein